MKDLNPQLFRSSMAPRSGLEPYACQVSLDGRSLFYYDSGSDCEHAPCLLVHGLGDEADTWHGVFLTLAARRRVIALDLPGFGRSELPQQPISIPYYVDILLQLLDHIKITAATLVGHSLGAVLVQQLSLQAPSRASNLVLIGGGLAAGKAPLSLDLLLFLIPGAGEWAYNRLRRDPQAAYRTLKPYYANLDALPQSERDYLFLRVNQRVWSDKQRGAFLGALRSLVRWLPAQQKNLAHRLAAVPVPTHILWGEQDQVAPSQNAHLLASLYPASHPAQVTLIPGAGHNLHQEFPQTVVELLV